MEQCSKFDYKWISLFFGIINLSSKFPDSLNVIEIVGTTESFKFLADKIRRVSNDVFHEKSGGLVIDM